MRETHCLSNVEKKQVRTQRESERAKGTHNLSSTERGPSQKTEGKRESKGNSHPVGRRGRNRSVHHKQASEGHWPT